MILKDLIMEIEFDDLLPYLKEIIVGHLDNIYAFREAYDILRSMKPNSQFCGEVHIIKEDDWVSVQSLDTDFWENELAKEIVLPRNMKLCKEEIAAYCIYDITFYGFSPEEITDGWRRNPDYNTQSKMERRKSIIQELTVPDSSFTYDDLAYLLHIQYGTRYDYHSVTDGQENRLVYIATSMIKYQQLDIKRYDSTIVCIHVSSQHPLTIGEVKVFEQNVCSWLNYEDIQFGMITEDTDCKETTVTLLLNKK